MKLNRKIKSVQVPDPPGQPGKIGDKIERTMQRIAALVLNSTREVLVDVGSGALELFFDILKPVLLKAYRPLLEYVRDADELPTEAREMLDTALSAEGEAGSALLMSLGTSAGGAVVGSVLSSALAPVTYAINRLVQPARVPPQLAYPIMFRNPSYSGDMYSHLKDQGYEDSVITLMQNLAFTRPDLGMLMQAELRQIMPKASVDTELEAQGFHEDTISIARRLAQRIPGMQDLITMSVREAFNPTAIDRLQLDSEFPTEFGEWAERQGFSKEWAHKYWVMHWVLPSLSMGYEMLHRRVINEDTLDALLKAQDVSPFWRDKLKAIAYSPLTRVDVRRMYGLGILNEEDVYNNYLDLSYSPEDARRMTEFTVAYETDTDRELTKADIIGGFSDGVLSEGEAIDLLQMIGYPQNRADYLISREIAQLDRKRLNAELDAIEDLYKANDINEGDARVRMTALEMASSEIEQKIALWSIARRQKTKRPTQAQLADFFERDIITEREFSDGMSNLGYQDQWIAWYLRRVLDDKADAARKAEADAREEQQKITERKTKTTYQREKAQLDVDLAEVRTAIAEQQIAIKAREQRYQEEQRITRQAVTTAELEEIAKNQIAIIEGQVDDLAVVRARLREQVDALETQIAELKAEQAGDVPDDRKLSIKDEIGHLQVEREKVQDRLAEVATEIAQRQASIAARREQLRRDLDIVGRVASLDELTTEYETDRARMQAQLDLLKVNLRELLEAKARLTVKYRTAA